jgi:hypothetical protein
MQRALSDLPISRHGLPDTHCNAPSELHGVQKMIDA